MEIKPWRKQSAEGAEGGPVEMPSKRPSQRSPPTRINRTGPKLTTTERGYPSRSGDGFKLDFAIKGPRTGLFGIGVDCDAPQYRLLAKARPEKSGAPCILERQIPSIELPARHGITSRKKSGGACTWRSRMHSPRGRSGATIG